MSGLVGASAAATAVDRIVSDFTGSLALSVGLAIEVELGPDIEREAGVLTYSGGRGWEGAG